MWHEAMHPMGWFGWAGHGVGLILMLLFWALVIAAVVYLVRGLSGRGARPCCPRASVTMQWRPPRGWTRPEWPPRYRQLLQPPHR